MEIPSDSRYNTVWKKKALGGFIVLRDSKDGKEEELIESLKPTSKLCKICRGQWATSYHYHL